MKYFANRLPHDSPFGYDREQFVDLGFDRIVRALSKIQFTADIATIPKPKPQIGSEWRARRGLSCRAQYAEVSKETVAKGNVGFAFRYDIAVLDALGYLTEQDGGRMYAWSNLVHRKQPSGTNWHDLEAAYEQFDLQHLDSDIYIETARRLGWVGVDGSVILDVAAALHAQFLPPEVDKVAQTIDGKRLRGERITDVALRVTEAIKPRTAVFTILGLFDQDYTELNGTVYDLAEYQTNAPLLLERYEKQYPQVHRLIRQNQETLSRQGYVGMSGIDIFFAELRRDFGRIDAVKL